MKCCTVRCEQDATHEAVFLIHPKGYFDESEYEPAKVKMGAVFCESHYKLVDAHDILSDEDWVKISLTFFKKKAQHPDPERVGIEWIKLN